MKTIITLDRANQPYGYPQLDGSGSLQATGSLFGTASYALSSGGGGGTGAGFPYSGSALITGSLTVNQPFNYLGLGKVSFEKTPYSSSQIDIITAGVTEIARDNAGGIYNAALEPNYQNNNPSGTLWNSIYTDPNGYGWGDIQSIPYRTYGTWYQAVNQQAGYYIVNLPMVMKDLSTGKFYLIKFYKWTQGGAGGGFAYDRYELSSSYFTPTSSFSRPANTPSTVDTISSTVILKRDDNGDGIYNSYYENEFDTSAARSPVKTAWNSIYTDGGSYGWNNLLDVRNRKYDSFYNAINSDWANVAGLPLIMHDIDADQYYAIKFNTFDSGSGTGEFSYDRFLISKDGLLVYQDGTVQSTNVIPSIKTKGSTIHSTNPAAGPNFSTNTSIFLGDQSGFNASSAYSSNFLGFQSGRLATNANYSNFLGYNAGSNAVSASNSNFLGAGAGQSATNADYSNFLGNNAGSNAINANNSNFLGNSAGASATNANNVNFLGQEAGLLATNAGHSTFIGNQAGYQAANAQYSNFLGRWAGYQASTAATSNFLGYRSGYQASQAQHSNFLGDQAGYQATNAGFSNFLGQQAGDRATNAIASNFIGNQAGTRATNAQFSNFIGTQAGWEAVSASYSILIGTGAGYKTFGTGIGSNNIIIGNNISLPNGTNDSINLGGIIFATGSYSTLGTVLSGSVGNGRVGINVANPQYNLDVSGSVNITSVLNIQKSNPLPTGTTGSLAVSGSLLYFHDGSSWREVSLI